MGFLLSSSDPLGYGIAIIACAVSPLFNNHDVLHLELGI